MTWVNFIQLLVIPLFSSILTLIGSLILVNVSERFRRFAFWEPFAKNLWDQQMTICSEIVSVAYKTLNDALFCFDAFNPDKNEQKKHAKDLSTQLSKLADLKAKRLVLCSPDFNQAVEEFTQQMLVVLGEFSSGKLNQNLSLNLPELWIRLVDESRSELRVDGLNSKTKEIVKESIKKQSGNSTLPY